MDDFSVLKGRVKDLASSAANRGYLTSTRFLSLSEQTFIKNEIFFLPGNVNEYLGVEYFFYGGYDNSDRSVIFFLPFYETKENIIDNIEEYLSLYKITPKNIKYKDVLTHRDVLGALMNLGLERDVFGDIICKEDEYYLIALNGLEDNILELSKIKHTDILISKIGFKEAKLEREFEEKNINVASLRLDAIIADVYNLSRSNAQELIENECVFVSGRLIIASSYEIKESERISIKGKGKFIFLRVERETRKQRLECKIRMYKWI